MTDLPPLEVNLLTAGPLLRLILAQHGAEPPQMSAQDAWSAFKVFMHFRSLLSNDVASFQATWNPEDTVDVPDPDPPIFYCTWSRELVDDSGPMGQEGRAIQIQWAFDPVEDHLGELEIWSDAFATLDEFFNAVEVSAPFHALLHSNAIAELYTVDAE